MSGLIAWPDTGELVRRIILRRWSDVPNGAFGVDPAFDLGIQRWAKVEPVQGISIRADLQTGEVPTHLFWVRYAPGTKPEEIDASHVIDWNGRRYRVIDAINVEDGQRFTRITTKELGVIR
jgi:head-tail adaptor